MLNQYQVNEQLPEPSKPIARKAADRCRELPDGLGEVRLIIFEFYVWFDTPVLFLYDVACCECAGTPAKAILACFECQDDACQPPEPELKRLETGENESVIVACRTSLFVYQPPNLKSPFSARYEAETEYPTSAEPLMSTLSANWQN